jgi:hypothetical protein
MTRARNASGEGSPVTDANDQITRISGRIQAAFGVDVARTHRPHWAAWSAHWHKDPLTYDHHVVAEPADPLPSLDTAIRNYLEACLMAWDRTSRQNRIFFDLEGPRLASRENLSPAKSRNVATKTLKPL